MRGDGGEKRGDGRGEGKRLRVFFPAVLACDGCQGGRKERENGSPSFPLSFLSLPLCPSSSYHIVSGHGKNNNDPRIESGCEREDICFFLNEERGRCSAVFRRRLEENDTAATLAPTQNFLS